MLVRTQNVLVGGNGTPGSISTNSPQWDTLTVGERESLRGGEGITFPRLLTVASSARASAQRTHRIDTRDGRRTKQVEANKEVKQ